MRIGIPREPHEHARLVSATPATVRRLVQLGYEVLVESGAGERARLPNRSYVEAGARIGDTAEAWGADVVAAVGTPTRREIDLLRPGATLIGQLAPGTRPELLDLLAERRITALALDAVPRISRAQSLDVLSALSNVAGYRAVIEAAQEFGGMFAGQVTAAGTTAPAKVFVIGAGVAGLAAIGTASSLGAQVRAFDVRPEAGEQVESMGATFVQAAEATSGATADGYAGALTEDQEAATRRLCAAECADADIVITTALVRGTAPTTVTAETIAAMRPGSVIVDLAAPGGGNAEATVPGERVVTDSGVIVLGWTDLPDRLPQHTSQLIGTNIANLLALMTPGRDGELTVDLEDAVVRGMTVARDGEVLWPPPPVSVTATMPSSPAGAAAATTEPEPDTAASGGQVRRRGLLLGLAVALAGLAVASSPSDVGGHVVVFVLAVIVGFYVISSVIHSLHTPLMSQTNAISGIILVGALLQVGNESWVVTTLAVVAASVAAINVFGGFLVTRKMLAMFRTAER